MNTHAKGETSNSSRTRRGKRSWTKFNRLSRMVTDVSLPLSATVFLFTDAIASSGMTVFPPLRTGVTLTSSHWIGTFSHYQFLLVRSETAHKTHVCSVIDIFYRLTDFRTNAYVCRCMLATAWAKLEVTHAYHHPESK
jgi:hypothetical protein